MPRIYALHEFDLALQQYRAPYRNYSPSMGRWTTLDPAGMVDGPNMYAYVRGNPARNLDIKGEFAIALPIAIPIGITMYDALFTALISVMLLEF